MRDVAIRDVHVEIVAWIAGSGPRLEDQLPRSIEGVYRVGARLGVTGIGEG